MSSEEDTELRDLVAQTLEVNGCLPKIRAELRASIFLALDSEVEVQKQEPLLNKKVKSTVESQEGRAMFCLVREFLEYYNLDFTVSVYEPESYLGTAYQYEGRSKIIEDLGVQLEENSTLPLLLQLIQLVKLKSAKSIDINLNKLHQRVEGSDKTVQKPAIELRATPKEANLNETFNLSSPSINPAPDKGLDVIFSPHSTTSSKSTSDENDTYEGTSSIADDSVVDLDKSSERSLSEEFSPPVLKDSKLHSKFDASFDKLKLSPQKAEKFKAKSTLTSLADLPPLQLNKSRNETILLPSLYSKDFKEKSPKLDKFFEVEVDPLDNYEEDFMSESEINLNKSIDSVRIGSVDELQSCSLTDSNKNITGRGKHLNQANQTVETNKTEVLSPKSNKSVATRSSTSSVTSEELNLNIDDILNSPTSN